MPPYLELFPRAMSSDSKVYLLKYTYRSTHTYVYLYTDVQICSHRCASTLLDEFKSNYPLINLPPIFHSHQLQHHGSLFLPQSPPFLGTYLADAVGSEKDETGRERTEKWQSWCLGFCEKHSCLCTRRDSYNLGALGNSTQWGHCHWSPSQL